MKCKYLKLKRLFFLFLFMIFQISCKNEKNLKPIAKFEKKIIFGKIKYDSKLIKTFKIKNISKEEIRIYDIKTSCGCTVPKINDSIILPNSTKSITVEYSPKEKDIGMVNQTIIVKANTEPSFLVLYLEGEVVK